MNQFGRKLKLPSTIAIKHQIRKLMAEDEVKKATADSRGESVAREESRFQADQSFVKYSQAIDR
jgi:hypothetical protein